MIDMAHDGAFQSADMIDIGNDALADRREGGALERDIGRRHVDGLAIIFDLVRQNHEPTGQVDGHALGGTIIDRDAGRS